MGDIHRTFAGSIPQYYDRYLVPLLFEPYARDLAGRMKLGPNASVIELACGTGVVTKLVARALGAGGSLTATDLNEAMIQVARAKLHDDRRISWRQADATKLPFEDNSFDVAFCQFGWMFFPDPARAAREARRVLRSGGHLFFNTWDRLENNPVMAEANIAIRACFPSNPPTFYDVPFSMHDAAEIENLLTRAGFRKPVIQHVSLQGAKQLPVESATGIVRGGPFITEIEERGGDVGAVIAAVVKRLSARFGNEPFAAPLSAFVCEATA